MRKKSYSLCHHHSTLDDKYENRPHYTELDKKKTFKTNEEINRSITKSIIRVNADLVSSFYVASATDHRRRAHGSLT